MLQKPLASLRAPVFRHAPHPRQVELCRHTPNRRRRMDRAQPGLAMSLRLLLRLTSGRFRSEREDSKLRICHRRLGLGELARSEVIVLAPRGRLHVTDALEPPSYRLGSHWSATTALSTSLPGSCSSSPDVPGGVGGTPVDTRDQSGRPGPYAVRPGPMYFHGGQQPLRVPPLPRTLRGTSRSLPPQVAA